MVVVEITVIRLTVVVEEKVVVKEIPQTLAVEEITVLVLVVAKVLQYVKRVELVFH